MSPADQPQPPPTPARVLFAHYGEDAIRGSERVLLDLLAHLDRSAVAPSVWCNTETMADAVRALGVPVHTVRMPVLLGWQSPKIALIEHARLRDAAATAIERDGVAVVHANSGAPAQWLVPAARRARVPLVTHLHAHYVLRDRCTLRLHQSSMLVGCSAAVVAPFLAEGVEAGRVRTIPNGVDVARLAAGDATTLRAALGIEPGTVTLTIVGALVQLKGHDVLLRALAELTARGVRCALLIVGTGPEETALRTIVGERGLTSCVHFLGRRQDVGAILRDATDVVVAPSRQEAFGLTVVEGAVFGRPSVASDIPGLRETVQEGALGLLVPPDDSTVLAGALEAMIVDIERRHALGARARAHALAQYSIGAMTSAFEELYAQCQRAPHPPGPGLARVPWMRLGGQWLRRRRPFLRTTADPQAPGARA